MFSEGPKEGNAPKFGKLHIPFGLWINSPRKGLVKLSKRWSSAGSVKSTTSETAPGRPLDPPESLPRVPPPRHHLFSRWASERRLPPCPGEGREGDGGGGPPRPRLSPVALKVYGEGLSEGATYKSVLATPSSSAGQLVREVLSRHGRAQDDPEGYLLCDAVGAGEEKGEGGVWRAEGRRALAPHEKPLTLLELWRPRPGRVRRLEIRRRSEVERERELEDDGVTEGINAQARRLQLSRSRLRTGQTSGPGDGGSLRRSVSEAMLNEQRRARRKDVKSMMVFQTERADDDQTDLPADETPAPTVEDRRQTLLPAPSDTPYFLLLQGYSERQDLLLHLMPGRSHVFGQTSGVTDVVSSISAPDILPRHCHIRRVVREGQKSSTYVQAFPGAHVSRNGCPVSRETRLHPGDLLGLGEHVLLMYKDPRHESGLPAWFPTYRGRTGPGPAFGCPACGRSLREDQEARRAYLASPLPVLRCGEDEDGEHRLLEEIAARTGRHSDGAFRLAPAYLFAACAQTSYEAYGPGRLARLLVKIAGLVKKVVWETVKDIGDKRPESPAQGSEGTPSARVKEMTSDLRPIMFWMANAVELLNFSQRKSSELEKEEAEGLLDDPSASVDVETCEEAMVLLDEVIMYTFQQCVYHLTKTLYSVLPALLDTNPFSSTAPAVEEEGAERTPPMVDSILAILGNALELGHGYLLHTELVSQMFGYLFFFCNASVLNTLMERGERDSFYQWTRGVQIRTNLDQVLDWTQVVGIGDIASRYLQKLSTAVNLLCIPKTSLLKMSWDTLLEDHSALAPAQLYHLLSNYQVGPSRSRPSAWDPAPCTLDELQKGEIFESFGEHPPLILPTSEFRLSLSDPVESEELRTLLCDLRQFAWELEKEALPVNQRPLC